MSDLLDNVLAFDTKRRDLQRQISELEEQIEQCDEHRAEACERLVENTDDLTDLLAIMPSIPSYEIGTLTTLAEAISQCGPRYPGVRAMSVSDVSSVIRVDLDPDASVDDVQVILGLAITYLVFFTFHFPGVSRACCGGIFGVERLGVDRFHIGQGKYTTSDRLTRAIIESPQEQPWLMFQ